METQDIYQSNMQEGSVQSSNKSNTTMSEAQARRIRINRMKSCIIIVAIALIIISFTLNIVLLVKVIHLSSLVNAISESLNIVTSIVGA